VGSADRGSLAPQQRLLNQEVRAVVAGLSHDSNLSAFHRKTARLRGYAVVTIGTIRTV
jgi:hypothetical protein